MFPSQTKSNQPNYEKLRVCLEIRYKRSVTIDEAINTGNHLIKIYEILLSDEFISSKIEADTTNQ
jgi:hypothetical protein